MSNDNDVLINVILDRSGSMGPLVSDVIGHFNTLKKQQEEQPGKALMTVVQFDTEYEELCVGRPIENVPDLDEDTYFARGGTALLDAIGKTINAVNRIRNKPNKVVFVINTDGYENSSKEFTKGKIKQLIDKYTREKDWQFVFVGAGIDAFSEAGSLGILPFQILNVSPYSQGYFYGYNVVSNAISNYRDEVTDSVNLSDSVGILGPEDTFTGLPNGTTPAVKSA